MFSKFFFRCNFLYFWNDFLQSDSGWVSGLYGKTRVLVRTSLGMRAGQSPTWKFIANSYQIPGVGDLDPVGSGSGTLVVNYLFQPTHWKFVLKWSVLSLIPIYQNIEMWIKFFVRLEVSRNLTLFVDASFFTKVGCEIVIFLSASYPRRGMASYLCLFACGCITCDLFLMTG